MQLLNGENCQLDDILSKVLVFTSERVDDLSGVQLQLESSRSTKEWKYQQYWSTPQKHSDWQDCDDGDDDDNVCQHDQLYYWLFTDFQQSRLLLALFANP